MRSQSVCMFMCMYNIIYIINCVCMCVCASDIIYIHTGWRCLKEDGVKRYCLMFSQTYLLSFSAWSGRFMAPCYTQ